MEFPDKLPIVAALLQPIAVETGGKNDLADERVVTLLLRGFVDVCLARFHEAMGGSLTQDEAADAIYDHAAALNAVFLGRSGFDSVTAHPWNTPDQLGVFVRDTMAFDFPAEECVRALLVHMATEMMVALQGERSAWEGQVDGMVAEVRDLLLGRPPEGADAPPFA